MAHRWSFAELNASREARIAAPPPAASTVLTPAARVRRSLTAPKTVFDPLRDVASQSTGGAKCREGFPGGADIESPGRKTDRLATELAEFAPWFDRLPSRIRTIVEMRVSGMKPAVIGAKLNVSGQNVSCVLTDVYGRLDDLRANRTVPRSKPCKFCGAADHDGRFHVADDKAKLLADMAARPPIPAAPPPPLPAARPPAPPLPDLASMGLSESPALDRARQKSHEINGRFRSKTLANTSLTKDEKQIAALELYPTDVDRPMCRADCQSMPRPCPFVSCSHHLYLDVNPETGAIKLNFPHLEVWDMRESCSLDVADKGGITLEEVGAILNLTRERIRQVEVRGMSKIKDHADGELGLPPDRDDY